MRVVKHFQRVKCLRALRVKRSFSAGTLEQLKAYKAKRDQRWPKTTASGITTDLGASQRTTSIL